MTDPISAMAGKAAGPVINLGARAIKRSTLAWRVRRQMIKSAALVGRQIDMAGLRQVLKDEKILAALSVGDLDRVDTCLNRVALTLPDGNQAVDGRYLRGLLVNAFLHRASTADAIAVSHDSLSRHIVEVTQQTVAGDSFESDLVRLPPTMALTAVAISQRHGAMRRIVKELVSASSRVHLVETWSKQPPPWIGNQWELTGWLGEVSLTLGSEATAVVFIDKALEQGAIPREYWKARRTWAAHDVDADSAGRYLADVSETTLIRGIALENSAEARAGFIEKWIPSNPAQESLKANLRVQSLRERELFSEAAILGESSFRESNFANAGLEAAEALLQKGFDPAQTDHALDASRALALALEIRDAQRRWGSASAHAVVIAMRAAQILANPARAWSLSQLAPEGEALPAEANNELVRTESLVLMAERGSIEQALAQISEGVPPFVEYQIRAREAELLLEGDKANNFWSQAIDATDDWNQKASLTIRLAMKGVRHAFIDDLRRSNPNLAEEIDLIGRLFADDVEAESEVKFLTRENSRIAHAYMSFLDRRQRLPELGQVAEQVAENWGEADAWLQAARVQLELQDSARAVSSANKALLNSTDQWGDRYAAHGVILQAAYRLEDWPMALQGAQGMLRQRPGDPNVRWAIVRIRFAAGDLQLALDELLASPKVPMPDTPYDAAVWLSLFHRFGAKMATLQAAIAVARKFADDKQVRSIAPAAVISAPGFFEEEDDDHPSPDLLYARQEIGALLASYKSAYPDSAGFEILTVDLEDPSTIFEALRKAVLPRPDLCNYLEPLSKGIAPLGFLSVITHRRLAETLILERERPRFAGQLTGVDEVALIRSVAADVVIADTTALLTIALTPDDASAALLACVPRLRTTNQQLMDANASRETLARPSAGFIAPPSTDTGSPTFHEADAERQGANYSIAERLVELFRGTERVTNPDQRSSLAKQLGDATGTWTSAIDLAITEGRPFWCDDAATRRLAEQAGVQSFGTPAVVEYLRQLKPQDADLHDSIDASLLFRWTVGVSFRTAPYRLGISLDGRKARGTAAAIAHGSKENLEEKIRLCLDAMGSTHDDPESLTAWAGTLASLVGGLTSEPDAARRNHAQLVLTLMGQAWMNAASLVFVTGPCRDAFSSDWEAIFELAVRALYRGLAAKSTFSIAAQYVIGLVAQLPDAEHRVTMRVILEP